MVLEHCRKHEVDYAENDLVAAWGIVINYLNRVGLSARDPFAARSPQSFADAYRHRASPPS